MAETAAQNSHDHAQPFKINGLRLVLAFFFALFAYIVARGMIPLPDEPPRINFWSLFYTTMGMVFALYILFGRYRLFWFMVPIFLVGAVLQLQDRMKFLNMMLEPNRIERVTQYALCLVFLLWFTPPVFRLFTKRVKEYSFSAPLFNKNGFPF